MEVTVFFPFPICLVKSIVRRAMQILATFSLKVKFRKKKLLKDS